MTHFQASNFEKILLLESLWNKETDFTSFASCVQIICKHVVKRNLNILSFLNYTSGYFKFSKTFAYLNWHGQGLFKNVRIVYNLLNIFLQTFLLYKKINFCKFAKFFADSKSRAQKLSNDVLFVIFGHQTRDLEGGGSNTPPQRILVFKYLKRDRVKYK